MVTLSQSEIFQRKTQSWSRASWSTSVSCPLHFSIWKKISRSLPNLGHGLGCIFFATLSDWLSNKYSLRVSRLGVTLLKFVSLLFDTLRLVHGWVFHERRISAFIGFFIGGGLFFLIMIIGCSVIWALTILTVGMTLLAFQAIAVKSNPNDLAPEYAGLLSGLANTLANNAG